MGIQERREQARMLRSHGLSYPKIASQLGIDTGTAYRDCNPASRREKHRKETDRRRKLRHVNPTERAKHNLKQRRYRAQGKHESLTYFIEAIGLDRVKIGTTNQLQARFSMLQCGCPEELRILGTTSVSEVELHQQFSHLHHRGEWYLLTQDILDFISRECVDGQYTKNL